MTQRAAVRWRFESETNTVRMTSDSTTPPATETDPEVSGLREQLTIFAREVGELYALERIRSRELERAIDDLRETYVATMTSLAQVVEAKDSNTRGHLERTEAYGMALARAIDPELAARPELSYGFFLHDIGKVGIPEAILAKPGALDEDEWAIMREHPMIGAQIVEPIRFLAGAVEIIRCHHERWDGRGYPRGLRGPQIPLEARVFALADAFDAMTSDRPYRRAMQVEVALDEIAAGAGKQFDPDVVEAFLELVDEEDLLGTGSQLAGELRAG
jgi:HD-GYP domain-containing protein (c-di-GMP phosphodiesterase class II)